MRGEIDPQAAAKEYGELLKANFGDGGLDMILLGMGDDGHTASLFPGSPNLRSALNPAAAAGCVGMWAPSAPQPRLSLNVSALLDSRHIVILIAGESKLRAYLAAGAAGPMEDMPVRAVLRQQRAPVEVIWAP